MIFGRRAAGCSTPAPAKTRGGRATNNTNAASTIGNGLWILDGIVGTPAKARRSTRDPRMAKLSDQPAWSNHRGRLRHPPPLLEVELLSLVEEVVVPAPVVLAVVDADHAPADHLEAVALDDDRGGLVDAEAQ